MLVWNRYRVRSGVAPVASYSAIGAAANRSRSPASGGADVFLQRGERVGHLRRGVLDPFGKGIHAGGGFG